MDIRPGVLGLRLFYALQVWDPRGWMYVLASLGFPLLRCRYGSVSIAKGSDVFFGIFWFPPFLRGR